jgi:hypothetical protein
MTEAEWLVSKDLRELLDYLVGRTTNRKFRLFACACCRRIWPLLDEERCRTAVSVAEQFADELASDSEVEAARKQATSLVTENALSPQSSATASWAYGAARGVLFESPFWADRAACKGAISVAWCAAEAAWRANGENPPGREPEYQLQLLRDVFENPYQPGWADPTWLDWDGCAIPRLAEAIYDDRAFERIPILADALEEAGCTDAAILTHLRSPGPHVRGCWVLDLLLGKE